MQLVWLLLSVFTITFARHNRIEPRNIFNIPPNCQPNQEVDVNGVCREIFRRYPSNPASPVHRAAQENDNKKVKIVGENESFTAPSRKKITDIPDQCPDGYRADALRFCRKKCNF